MAVLLVEQNVLMTLKLADRHYIIDSGRIIYEGSNEDLRGSVEIQKRYLSV
jgi:branched-chain amino acid transport system ATP-binding protein